MFFRRLWHRASVRGAVLLAALALVTFGGRALAGGNGADVVKNFPVSYTLSSAQCPNLPPGTTITGTGTGTSVTNTSTDASGVTTMINTTHSNGTATDQAGNTYVWNYSNHLNISNSVEAPDYYSGKDEDHFSLAGPGPAHLSNGFLVQITFGPNPNWPNGFYAVPIEAHGDPVTFPYFNGPGCDPI
jgi:hypothetical protein